MRGLVRGKPNWNPLDFCRTGGEKGINKPSVKDVFKSVICTD